MKPEPRSGLSLARLDCPSLNRHYGVDVPDLRLRSSNELLPNPFGYELPSSLPGRISARNPLLDYDSPVWSFLEPLLPFRNLSAFRITAEIRFHSRGLPNDSPDFRLLPDGYYLFIDHRRIIAPGSLRFAQLAGP
jgi:hypothetical protein